MFIDTEKDILFIKTNNYDLNLIRYDINKPYFY